MPPTQPPTEPPTQAKCESWCNEMIFNPSVDCLSHARDSCGGCPACKSVLSAPPASPASQVPTEPPTQPPTEPPTQAKCESWCKDMISIPSVDCLPTYSTLNALHCGGCPACKSVLSTPPPSPASQVPTMPPTQPPTEPPTQAKCESDCKHMIVIPSVDCLINYKAPYCGGCPACKSVLSTPPPS